MDDRILMSRNEVREAADALFHLTDWLEEHDRSEDDIARIESLGASLLSASQIAPNVAHIWYFIIDGNRSDYMGPDVELFATEQAAQARLIEWANDFMAEGGDDVEPVETFAEAQTYVDEMVIGPNIYIDSRPLQG